MMKDIIELKKRMDEDMDQFLFLEKHMRCFESLTQKRVEMFRMIMERNPSSIRELADFLERDIKNVFDDLRVLDDLGMIRFVVVGRRKMPVVKRKFIVISFE